MTFKQASQIHEILTSALNGCGWSDLHLDRCTVGRGCSGQSVKQEPERAPVDLESLGNRKFSSPAYLSTKPSEPCRL